jgi:ornithine cyclodeaminase/alanine dehydrogenase
MSQRPVFVSNAAVDQVLTWPAMIESLRKVYSMPHGPHQSPPRTVARGEGNWMRTLTGVLPTGTVMGLKAFGLPQQKRARFQIILVDQKSGEILAYLDANAITQLRTGATTAVGVDRMAGPGPITLGMIGSGLEARSHLRALAAVRKITEVKVFSRTPENREAYANELGRELDLRIRPVATPREAVEGMSVVCTTTNAAQPAFEGAWMQPGVLLVSIGATLPEHWELDSAAIERTDLIVADVPEENMEDTGCDIEAKKAGVKFEHKFSTLNDLMLGKLDNRLKAARFPMYRSAGAALQDLAVAEVAYHEALKRGLAVELPMEFAVKGGRRQSQKQ